MEKKDLEVVKTDTNSVALRTSEGFVAVAQDFIKNHGEVVLPPNYDVNDAVKSLYLAVLQTVDKQKRPVLEVCTRTSLEQVIQQYVSKGLNIAKTQCYLVPYGNTLTLQESYFGKQKQAKEMSHITQRADVVYKGEFFEVKKRADGASIVFHEPDVSKWDTNEILFAYSVATRENGEIDNTEVMTIKELKTSASKAQNAGTVYKEFPVEMFKKIVIKRQAKHYINTTDDQSKFILDNNANYDYSDLNSDIDASTLIIEDNVKVEKTKPVEQPTQTENAEMVIENIDGENIKEISYAEFKDNQDKYRTVNGSYDKVKKTIKVYC